MLQTIMIKPITIKKGIPQKISKKKYIELGCVILIGLIFYSLNATKSGLWYDEAVEYFYSKYLTGPVPGGFGTENMYERIRNTFQPPLYNVVMYFWLALFDSEYAFRFAGILTTVIGSIGCFLAIEEIFNDDIWGVLGTAFYLFTPGVVYYGLECAEYNLMMCFIAWTTYFFLRVIVRCDRISLFGFFVFSCLSVYSQYGAAFIISGMYVSIIVFFILKKKYSEIKQLTTMSIITFFVAVLPLVVFFVLPQMNRQGTVVVSHMPFFRHGLVIDFFVGVRTTLTSIFGHTLVIGAIVLIIICCLALFLEPEKVGFPVLALMITWVLYFIAVCCSYYGYNSWNPSSIGSMNFGGRYAIFFIPCVVVILILGLGITINRLKKNEKYAKCLLFVIVLCLTFYCSIEIYRTSTIGWIKDDVREATLAWYDCKGYKAKTLLHQRDDANFNFYLTHDKRFDKSYLNSIKVADEWIQSAEYDEVREKLQEMGYLSAEEFYYMAPNSVDFQAFISVVNDEGYNVEKLYDGHTGLLHLTK